MEALSFIGTLISLIVVGTTLWVGLDASRLMKGISKEKRAEIGGKTLGAPRSPAGWVAGCMLLWIVFFPSYLSRRQKYLAFQRERFMEEYNRQKAEGLEPLSWEEAEASKKTPFPIIAFVLIAINIVAWSIMEGMGGSSDPSVLVRFGAQDNELVVAGQYWRLFTSMSLHIGLEHLALNCLALMLFAPIIESKYGRARFLGLYLISGYFGNLLFLAFGQSTIISAGASGAIFGVLGAHIPLSRRLKERGSGGMKPRGLAGLGYVVWVFVRSIGVGINVLAHFGGVVAGIVLGYVFCPVTVTVGEQAAVQPRVVKRKLAGRAVAIGLVLLALTAAGTFTSSAWRERVGTDGWHFAPFRRRAESRGTEPRIELRQKFLPARYEMVASEVTDTVMKMKGETEVSHSSETMWFDIRSSRPDASGTTTCVMKIKRIKQSDEDGSFDTDDPVSRLNPSARIFSRMLGREFVVKFGPDWELVSVSGLDEMWGAMADAAEAEEPGSGQFVRQMKESLGDEGAKHFLHLGYDMMPQKPVGVGAIWHRKESVKVPFVGTMRSDSELELTGIEETSDGKVAHIAITSDTRSGKGAETVLGPVSMTFRSMDLRQEGTIRLNADTGLLLDSESKTSGGMRLIVRGPDGKRVSGTMKLSMTEETSVRPTLGKFPEAIAEYEKASKLGSVSLETLADAYKRQGDWEKAIATYKEAARRSPDLHVKLGDLYRSRGMLDEAIAEYDASEAPVRAQIERGSANANGYNELAWFYVTKKIKPQEAVSLAEKAVELAPADATILDTLRWAYLRNGQFAEALETFRKILVSQPGPRLSFSGWRAVAEIARSSIEGGVFLRFCDDMNELSKSMADKVASEHTLIWVQSVLAQFHEHRGEKEKAEEQWRKAGFIKTSSWLVIGPFDNVGGSGFFKAYPPEQSIDLHATYQARGTKIGWAELNPDSYGAFVDLEEVLDDNQWAVAYAFARVHSAQETQAQLRVGSDDDVKVWLNGKEVLSTNVARVAVIDQDIVSVNLKEGTNEILLKVCNRAGGWGFHLRITDSQGRPLEGLGYIPAAELRSTVPK